MKSLLLIFLLFISSHLQSHLYGSKELKEVWSLSIPRFMPLTVHKDANRPYLYLAQKNGGLAIYQTRARRAPTLLTTLNTKRFSGLDVTYLEQHGTRLYLALGDFFKPNSHAGFAVVNINNPKQPRILSLWKSKRFMHGISSLTIHKGFAYLSAMKSGILIFDLKRPKNLLSEYIPFIHFPKKNPNKISYPNARGCAVKGDFLYLAYDAGGIRVIDISNKKRPREVARYINQGMGKKQQAYNHILIKDNLLYAPVDYAGLEIIDITNPLKLRQVSWWNPWKANTPKNIWFNSPGHLNQPSLNGTILYVSAGDSEIQGIDISNPKKPKLAYHYGGLKDKYGAWGTHCGKKYIFTTYIRTPIPFMSTWSGVKACELP